MIYGKHLCIALLAVLLMATNAKAELRDHLKGFYIAGLGEIVFMKDTLAEVRTGPAPQFPLGFNLDTGYGGGVAIGYKFNNNIRAEIEGIFRSHDGNVKSLSSPVTFDYEQDTINCMFNLLYDFNVDLPLKAKPFIGAGVGISDIDFEFGPSGVPFFKGDDRVFAYQVMAGVTLPIKERHELFLGYRYFGTSHVDTPADNIPLLEFAYDNRNHVIMAGYRFLF